MYVQQYLPRPAAGRRARSRLRSPLLFTMLAAIHSNFVCATWRACRAQLALVYVFNLRALSIRGADVANTSLVVVYLSLGLPFTMYALNCSASLASLSGGDSRPAKSARVNKQTNAAVIKYNMPFFLASSQRVSEWKVTHLSSINSTLLPRPPPPLHYSAFGQDAKFQGGRT